MTYKIQVRDKIPFFKIRDHKGLEVKSNDLMGKSFVLYFYPKDDTPGCTKEACSFRDNREIMDALDTLVIGVSPDSAESHIKFINKYNLNYTLLCDEKGELAKSFDVVRENGKLERTTFLIDTQGIIQWLERPVNVNNHVERVIQAVNAMRQVDL